MRRLRGAANDEIYIPDIVTNTIGVFARSASNTITPTRTTTHAGLLTVWNIAVDTTNDEIYVASVDNSGSSAYAGMRKPGRILFTVGLRHRIFRQTARSF